VTAGIMPVGGRCLAADQAGSANAAAAAAACAAAPGEAIIAGSRIVPRWRVDDVVAAPHSSSLLAKPPLCAQEPAAPQQLFEPWRPTTVSQEGSEKTVTPGVSLPSRSGVPPAPGVLAAACGLAVLRYVAAPTASRLHPTQQPADGSGASGIVGCGGAALQAAAAAVAAAPGDQRQAAAALQVTGNRSGWQCTPTPQPQLQPASSHDWEQQQQQQSTAPVLAAAASSCWPEDDAAGPGPAGCGAQLPGGGTGGLGIDADEVCVCACLCVCVSVCVCALKHTGCFTTVVCASSTCCNNQHSAHHQIFPPCSSANTRPPAPHTITKSHIK
jgi:hypothetical protein